MKAILAPGAGGPRDPSGLYGTTGPLGSIKVGLTDDPSSVGDKVADAPSKTCRRRYSFGEYLLQSWLIAEARCQDINGNQTATKLHNYFERAT